jgi:hypothetical protein
MANRHSHIDMGTGSANESTKSSVPRSYALAVLLLAAGLWINAVAVLALSLATDSSPITPDTAAEWSAGNMSIHLAGQ